MNFEQYVKDQFDAIQERHDHFDKKLDKLSDEVIKHRTLWGIASAIALLILGEVISHAF